MGIVSVGQSVPRYEDPYLLRGEGRFTADIKFPDQAYGYVLRSPHAFAKINGIDISKAEEAPGVLAVLTGADMEADQIGPLPNIIPPLPNIDPDQMFIAKRHILATDMARLAGHEIAFIVAESRHVAEDAQALIDVDYQTLKPIVDVRQALGENAPLAHDGAPDNLAAELNVKYGDIDEVFANADHHLNTRFMQHRGGCHAMECRGVVAVHDPRENELTIWSATQCPYLIRRALAKQFDLPEENLRLIAPDVGGGFGPKAGYYVEEAIVPFAAKLLGRPVKWIDQVLELALTHTPTPLSEAEVEEDLALAEEKAQKGSERPSTH